jgi:hypothetical protein
MEASMKRQAVEGETMANNDTPQEQFVADKLRELFTEDELYLMGTLAANEADVMEASAPYRATLVSIMRKLRLVVPVCAPGRGSPAEVSRWLDKQPR